MTGQGVSGELAAIPDDLVRRLEKRQSELRQETLHFVVPHACLVRLDHAELLLHHLTLRLAAAEHCIVSKRARKRYRKLSRVMTGKPWKEIKS